MLKMPKINDIRELYKSGYKIEEIHRMTGADQKTIRKYLEMDDFSPKPPVKKKRQSIVEPYADIITGWLREDQNHWKKQWHTVILDTQEVPKIHHALNIIFSIFFRIASMSCKMLN